MPEVNLQQKPILERLFSSRVRIRLLSRFLMHTDTRDHIRALASKVDAQYNAVWKELNNLELAGLLQSEAIGGMKVFSLNPNSPIIPELRSILIKTVVSRDHFRKSLGDLEGIRFAFIFGSFARGELDANSDLDLMIIGEIDGAKISSVIQQFETQFARNVNYTLYTENEWKFRLEANDPFIMNVHNEQKIMLIGTQDDF